MEYQQKQEGSFFINEASVITAYFQKQLNIIERILEKRHRKMSKEDIHRLRIAVKKIKALSTLVLFCRPDFRINKFMKPFNRIFKVAGKMRELQLEISQKDAIRVIKRLFTSLKNAIKKEEASFL